MAEKNKRQRARKDTATVELIVRRGARERFQKLKKKAAHLPVKVAWDRRLEERRAASEQLDIDRRKSDRRGNPPFSWEVGDFVLVEKRQQRRKRKV
jgi:hypothetical protein